MSLWVEQIGREIARRKLFRRGQGILVAVSGGLDSMVLLEVLNHLAPESKWSLTVAHFNHSLRGRSSDADKRLTRLAAERLELPFVSDRGDVRGLAKEEKLSIEMAARRLRHQFLAQAARRRGISSVALAHHADDQAELFFVRLLRGCGGEGLSGMKWRGPSPADSDVSLVRPLLGVPKDALREYAAANRIKYREDASNAQMDALRNRVRHELLPLLAEKYQPGLARTIPRVMDILGGDAAFAAEAAARWLGRMRRPGFESLHLGVQRHCLRLQLIAAGVTPDYETIEQLRLQPDRRIIIGPGVSVMRGVDGLVRLMTEDRVGFENDSLDLDLANGAGEAAFGGAQFRWQFAAGACKKPLHSRAGAEQFDADKVGASIRLRHWHPGDRFQPIGMSREVKLQDLFTNLKIPRSDRRRLVVGEAAGGKLFWVEGLRISESFKLDKGTVRRLKWDWQRQGSA